MSRDTALIRLLNLSEEPIILRKNTMMAWLEPAAVITEKNKIEGEIRETKTTVSHKQKVRDAGLCVPDHIQNLFHRSCKKLGREEKGGRTPS
jgi:hypothetical protein